MILILLCAQAFCYAEQTAGDKLDSKAVAKELQEKIAGVKSYTAEFRMDVRMGEQRSVIDGTIAYKTPGKVKMEMKTKSPKELTQLTVSDGKTLCIYVPENNVAYLYNLAKMSEEEKKALISQSDLFHPLRDMDPQSISLQGLSRTEGERAYLFEGKPTVLMRSQNKQAFNKMKIWVGQRDGLLRKVVIYDDKGRETLVQDYRNIKTNVFLSDTEFTFTPPEGTTINLPGELKRF